MLLESTLTLAGAQPIAARIGRRSAARARTASPFDAMVSDIAMPGQDGYTLMTLLKDRLGDAHAGARRSR